MARSSDRVPRSALAYPAPPGFNGHLLGPYRWFSGRPMNGHRYTDATFLRYGTLATDISGRATPYQLLPGYQRFLYARLPIMVAPAAAVALALEPGQTGMLGLGLAGLAAKRLDTARRSRRFRRQVVEPVAAAASDVLRQRNVAKMGHTWVHVPEDFRDREGAEITMRLPMGWVGEDGDKARLARVVAQRLQVDEVTPHWSLYGAAPTVAFTVPAKPPAKVGFLDGVAMASELADTDLAMGAGPRDRCETFSLTLESPHLLVAGGSGAGKSELLAYLVGQFMRRGYGVAVLDAKYVSHMWLRSVPGVLYASEDAELHEALVWLDGELVRRARFVAKGGDPSSLVPLVVMLEEINGASNRLRAYWKTIRSSDDVQQSPAITALANLANLGREMRVHIILAGQSVTARSTGGPEGRESFQGRVLGRATAAQWRMLAPQIKPAPVKRQGPGRWHLVVGDTLREFQAPFMDIKDETARLIEWATGGLEIPDVVAMMSDDATTADATIPRSEVVSSQDGISLRAYADGRGVSYQSLINWRSRRPDFPLETGEGANRIKLYDAGHLDQFVASRLREPADVE